MSTAVVGKCKSIRYPGEIIYSSKKVIHKIQIALREKSRSSKRHSRAIRINHADPLSNKRYIIVSLHATSHQAAGVHIQLDTESENRWLGMMGEHQALKKSACCDQSVNGNSE